MTRLSRRAGLTLLELLIALALLAMIAGGIASSLGLGLRLYDRSTRLDAAAEPLAARILLRRLLVSALPPSQITPFTALFTGSTTGFSFTTLAGRSLAPDAAALRVAVAVRQDELWLTLTAVMDDGALVPVLDTLLAEGVVTPGFAYYDPALPDPWRGDWVDPLLLPALVLIEAAPGSRPDWPEFTAAPALGP